VSRVHCLDCGTHVVVDPQGRCPEGHEVGAQGARIEGSLGSGTPHPDEPEPWVARIELDDEVAPAPATTTVRTIRPPAAPAAPAPSAAPAAMTGRTEDLLRELHSLGDLDGPSLGAANGAPLSPPTSTRRPARPAAPTPKAPDPLPAAATSASTNGAPPAEAPTEALSAEASRSAFDELTALEAAVHALTGPNGQGVRQPSTNGHGLGEPSDNGHPVGELGTDGHGATGSNATGQATNGDVVEEHAPARPASATPAALGSVAESLGDLFRGESQAEQTAPAPPTPAPASPPTSSPVAPAPDGPERWSVLADVAEFTEARPAPHDQAVAPAAAPAVAADEASTAAASTETRPEGALDLANFTARGKRVSKAEKGKRRLFGR
jgi:hypothetical protein